MVTNRRISSPSSRRVRNKQRVQPVVDECGTNLMHHPPPPHPQSISRGPSRASTDDGSSNGTASYSTRSRSTPSPALSMTGSLSGSSTTSCPVPEPALVAIRVRPPPEYPIDTAGHLVLDRRGELVGTEVPEECWIWTDRKIVHDNETRGIEYDFKRICGPECDTGTVYVECGIKSVVSRVFEGFNGCVFAYGQTNSGKTHTISGTPSQPGIIPHAVTDFFNHIKQNEERVSLLRVSFFEIYNEEIRDLLAETEQKLTIQEDPERGVIITNMTEHLVDNLDTVMQLQRAGEVRRAMGRNNVHEHASRSHTVFQLIFESRNLHERDVKMSTLSIVDLAGSEATNTVADSVEDALEEHDYKLTIEGSLATLMKPKGPDRREREGSNIRKSLLALVRVVNMLASRAKGGHDTFIPYRDSKLTRLLRPALGGNSNCAIVCTINPCEDKETFSTLRFAQAAQHIHNKPRIVNVSTTKGLLQRYQEELKHMKKDMIRATWQSDAQIDVLKEEKQTMQDQYSLQLQLQTQRIEQMEKEYNNLNKFVLTSQKIRDDEATSEGRGSEETCSSKGTSVPSRRRNSFNCLRDKPSRSLFEFAENIDDHKDAQTSTYSPTTGKEEKEHHDLQAEVRFKVIAEQRRKISTLEDKIGVIERRHAKEVDALRTNLALLTTEHNAHIQAEQTLQKELSEGSSVTKELNTRLQQEQDHQKMLEERLIAAEAKVVCLQAQLEASQTEWQHTLNEKEADKENWRCKAIKLMRDKLGMENYLAHKEKNRKFRKLRTLWNSTNQQPQGNEKWKRFIPAEQAVEAQTTTYPLGRAALPR
eukprot:TRINITY_DN59877_c0_g1_i1.p1 TRINITY_DN59877_c0_g1~~TRINITY_DN59877_c0_g1_i1.p1  ORF type:complete len:829 (+),score=55.35 TRINITY_DN59877_c0_g1_i1:39-2489(+)